MFDSATPWLLGAILLLLSLQAYWSHRLVRSSANGRERVPLPLSSGKNIAPNSSAQITARPHRGDFRPERLIISCPQDWIVNDIVIDGVSQFSQSGDVPGEMFAAESQGCWVRFEEVPRRGEFQIVVTYIGSNSEGAPFVAAALGSQRTARFRRPRDRRTDDRVLLPREAHA